MDLLKTRIVNYLMPQQLSKFSSQLEVLNNQLDEEILADAKDLSLLEKTPPSTTAVSNLKINRSETTGIRKFKIVLVDQVTNLFCDFKDNLDIFAKEISELFPQCEINTSSYLVSSSVNKLVFVFYQTAQRVSPEEFQRKCNTTKTFVGNNCIFCFGTIGQFPPYPDWLEDSSGYHLNNQFYKTICLLKLVFNTTDKTIAIEEKTKTWTQIAANLKTSTR